ncbi:hypothetical protein NDU88_002218 [Pleurodeles waltl]|uniref:Uncharacterized protein n=1 Tax=Pleurodeles waltl TaxID=8319 RepID=A0AAV7LF37_PLEWA|nr:hypothetical protein NDU88_002218 [Pleurodeles waltl]
MAQTHRSAGCACRQPRVRRPCRRDREERHPAGDSGTGNVPRWSSVGCDEEQQGFPFGGIQAEPAQARFLGGSPRSLVVRQHTLFRLPGRRQQRLLGLLEAHPGRAEGAGAPPFLLTHLR